MPDQPTGIPDQDKQGNVGPFLFEQLLQKGAARNQLNFEERATLAGAIYALGKGIGQIYLNVENVYTHPGTPSTPIMGPAPQVLRRRYLINERPVRPELTTFPGGTLEPTGEPAGRRDARGRFLPFNPPGTPLPQVQTGTIPGTPDTVVYQIRKIALGQKAGEFLASKAYFAFLGQAESKAELAAGLGTSVVVGGPSAGIVYTGAQIVHSALDLFTGRREVTSFTTTGPGPNAIRLKEQTEDLEPAGKPTDC